MTGPWTDNDLTAFLDGALSPRDARRLEADLANDPQLARRLDALTIDTDALRKDFDLLLQAASPNIAPMVKAAPRTRLRAWHGMALAASLAAGIIVGLQFTAPDEDWQDLAANYHLLYGAETLAPVDDDLERITVELARVAQSLAREMPLDALQAPAGIRLKRAQMLAYEGRPLAQIAYVTPAGEPIALCIIADEDDAVLRSLSMRGMAAATWSANGYGFLLIGTDDRVLIDRAAQELSTLL